MDVFIHEDYRGCGLGKWLVKTVLSHSHVQDVRRWTLATSDAHALYSRLGFTPQNQPEIWMERLDPFPEK